MSREYRLCNRDEEGELFFFRTNDGLEVDLLRRTQDGVQPIEIKSSTTWSKSLTDGLEKYRRLFLDATRPTLVYGGKNIPATADAIAAVNFLDFT